MNLLYSVCLLAAMHGFAVELTGCMIIAIGSDRSQASCCADSGK